MSRMNRVPESQGGRMSIALAMLRQKQADAQPFWINKQAKMNNDSYKKNFERNKPFWSK